MKFVSYTVFCLSAQIYLCLPPKTDLALWNIFPLTPGLMLSHLQRALGHMAKERSFSFLSAHLAVSYSMGGGCRYQALAVPSSQQPLRISSSPCFQQLHNLNPSAETLPHEQLSLVPRGQISMEILSLWTGHFSVIP